MLKRLAIWGTYFIFVVLAFGTALADFSLSGNSTIKPCDDFATLVLGDPWDMSNRDDILNFIDLDLSYVANPSFNDGMFSFVTTETAGGTVRFLAPNLPAALPLGGRWGSVYKINTSKYTHFSVRMSMDRLDDNYGLALLWNRGNNYGLYNTYTNFTSTVPRASTYTVNLNTIGVDTTRSDNTNLWSSGNIEGLGLLPTVNTQGVKIDYARLEDPTTCGSDTYSYSVSASAEGSMHNLYLDDDDNPFNGYYKKLVTGSTVIGATSTTISSLGIQPGTYNVVGFQGDDYATIFRDDPWDFNESTDLTASSGISDSAYRDGKLLGVASNAVVFMRMAPSAPIDASRFNKLSFKISPRTDVVVTFNNGSGNVALAATMDGADGDGDGVYELDLSGNASWTGSISTLAFSLNYPLSTSFEMDFVALRSDGYVTGDTTPSITVHSSGVTVGAPPVVHIVQPDHKGGEAVRPWNFRPGDTAFSENVSTDVDADIPTEALSTYLPDVRTVDGLRGDFLKGTNIAGNDDPHDFLFFPYFTTTNNYTIDADKYKYMCVRMMIDREYDLGLGSVSRLSFITEDDRTVVTEEWGVIYDRWSGSKWYEFCGDLSTFYAEGGGYYWGGKVKSFRFDPHEFHYDTCCQEGAPYGNPISATYYLDYIKIRKADESRGKYAIVYETSDPDSSSLTVTFFYNSAQSTTGGTQIGAGDLTCDGEVCIWDTSGVAAGTYYLYAVVSDGTLSTSRLASGVINIVNTGNTDTAPILALDVPEDGMVVCSSLQVKGYALMESRYEDVSAVQLYIDDVFVKRITPTLYSPAAVTGYPSADSSNTGFDEFHDVSGLSDGSHSVIVKAFSSDGGVATSTFTVDKQTGCIDTGVSDPDPAGTPIASTQRDDLSPGGDGLSLSLQSEGNDLVYLISGTRYCQLIRIGVSLVSGGPYTYIYGNSDANAIDSGFISATSSTVPRFVGEVVLVDNSRKLSKLRKQLKRRKRQCRAARGTTSFSTCKKKQRKLAKKIKKLNEQERSPSSKADGNGYFIADCNQGQIASNEQSIDASTIGCDDAVSCDHFSDLGVWFNYLTVHHRPE